MDLSPNEILDAEGRRSPQDREAHIASVAPVHEAPEPEPQPMQEMMRQLTRARKEVGVLVSRLDQVEATVRRLDRQTIMMVGSLALVLYVTRQALTRVQELQVDGV
jgi:hypothetical protein